MPLTRENYLVNNELVKEILVPPLLLNDKYSDYGVDEDGDGKYNYIAIELGVDVFEKGEYFVKFDLESFLGAELEEVRKYVEILEQDNNITIFVPVFNIRKMELNGPYRVKNLEIWEEGILMDSREEAFLTQAYKIEEFEEPSRFTRKFSDYGVDTDGDELYNSLIIEVETDIKSEGEYWVTGVLYSFNREYIASAYNGTYFSTGVQDIILNFDGVEIRKKGFDGPYLLREIWLEKHTILGEKYVIEQHDYIREAYETKKYNYDEFEDVKDVGVRINIDKNYLVVNELNEIGVEVFNEGTKKAENINVFLYRVEKYCNEMGCFENLNLIETKRLPDINSDEKIVTNFNYMPTKLGYNEFRVILEASNEGDNDNNIFDFGFNVVEKSIINNFASSELNGRLLMKIMKWDGESEKYEDVVIIVDEIVGISPGSYLALDKKWLERGAYALEEGGGYRVYVAILDDKGEIIENLEDYYDFRVFGSGGGGGDGGSPST